MVTTFQIQEPTPRVVLASAVALMVHYFDIREVDAWTEVLVLAGRNPPEWIRIAVIEALYQGRYKVVSVQQILDIWRRRGKILNHFNREFEAIVTVPLPDRVQAQLREFAREQQLAARQKHQKLVQQSSPVQPVTPVDATGLEDDRLTSQPLTLDNELPQRSLNPPSPGAEEHPLPSASSQSALDPSLDIDSLLSTEALAPLASSSDTLPQVPVPDLAVVTPVSTAVPTTSPRLKTLSRPSSNRIGCFCPTPDPSGFDRKLMALANQA